MKRRQLLKTAMTAAAALTLAASCRANREAAADATAAAIKKIDRSAATVVTTVDTTRTNISLVIDSPRIIVKRRDGSGVAITAGRARLESASRQSTTIDSLAIENVGAKSKLASTAEKRSSTAAGTNWGPIALATLAGAAAIAALRRRG